MSTKKQKLIERLKGLVTEPDREAAHIEADKALLAYINDDEVSEIYRAIEKWYA